MGEKSKSSIAKVVDFTKRKGDFWVSLSCLMQFGALSYEVNHRFGKDFYTIVYRPDFIERNFVNFKNTQKWLNKWRCVEIRKWTLDDDEFIGVSNDIWVFHGEPEEYSVGFVSNFDDVVPIFNMIDHRGFASAYGYDLLRLECRHSESDEGWMCRLMLGVDNSRPLGFGNYADKFHCSIREDCGLSFSCAEPVAMAAILHFIEKEEEIAYERMIDRMEREFKKSKEAEKQDD